MQLREMETSAALVAERNGDYDVGLFNWTYGGTNGDPDAQSLYAGNTNNFSRWNNPDAQKLLQQGAAETDANKRKQIYSDLQKLVAEEVPFLYVMYWSTVLHFNKRIKGMPTTATNPYWLYQEFRQLLDRGAVGSERRER